MGGFPTCQTHFLQSCVVFATCWAHCLKRRVVLQLVKHIVLKSCGFATCFSFSFIDFSLFTVVIFARHSVRRAVCFLLLVRHTV